MTRTAGDTTVLDGQQDAFTSVWRHPPACAPGLMESAGLQAPLLRGAGHEGPGLGALMGFMLPHWKFLQQRQARRLARLPLACREACRCKGALMALAYVYDI